MERINNCTHLAPKSVPNLQYTRSGATYIIRQCTADPLIAVI